MKRYAIINTETNIVVNVSVWDGETPWSPGQGFIAIQSDIAEINDIYNAETGEFTKPENII